MEDKIQVIIRAVKDNNDNWVTREDTPHQILAGLYSKTITSKEDLSWEEIKYILADRDALRFMAQNIQEQLNIFFK
jgi:hypothetical protein